MRPRAGAAFVLGAVALAGCGGGATKPAARTPFDYDAGAPLHVKTAQVSGPAGVDVRAVGFDGAHGDRVDGLFAVPQDGGSGACVVFQGGLGSHKEDARTVWPAFAAMGAATLTLDAREQAASTPPGRLEAAFADPARVRTVFADTVVDVRRGLDWLQTTGTCDAGRIAYVGVSFGGLVGAMAGGVDDRIGSAALIAAGGDFPTLLRRSSLIAPLYAGRGAARERAAATLQPLDPARWTARIAPRPLLLVNGTRDTVVPPASARALRRADPEAKVVSYPGGHDALSGPAGKRVVASVLSWLRPHLSAR